MRISVVGAGSWGTALAQLLAKNGHAVSLWVYEAKLAETLRRHHVNDLYLPGVFLPESVQIETNIGSALTGAQAVIFAVPSHVTRPLLAQAAPFLPQAIPMISATKGIERQSLLLMSQVIQEVLGRKDTNRIAILSGPSFAQEVAIEHPTAVTLAASEMRLAVRLRRALTTPYFKLFLSNDLIGVQLGGALKNVLALCAGLLDGLGYPGNTKAALMTRGLSEMTQLGMAMGAQPLTFYGLSGMGDLFLTCTGALSRNRRVGEKIGQGQRLSEILPQNKSVAEGVHTTESAVALAQKYHVEMPIIHEMYRVLFEGKSPKHALIDLMKQARGRETHAYANIRNDPNVAAGHPSGTPLS